MINLSTHDMEKEIIHKDESNPVFDIYIYEHVNTTLDHRGSLAVRIEVKERFTNRGDNIRVNAAHLDSLIRSLLDIRIVLLQYQDDPDFNYVPAGCSKYDMKRKLNKLI